jgi:hypothetical protein
MKENLSIMPVRDKDKKPKIMAAIDEVRRKTPELLKHHGSAAFRVNNSETLVVYARPSYANPDLSLYRNDPVIEQDTGRKAYTYVNLTFDRQEREAYIEHGAFIVGIDGKRARWPDPEPEEPAPSLFGQPRPKIIDKEQALYDGRFADMLPSFASHDLNRIMHSFRMISSENRVNSYGRTLKEAQKDREINSEIETISESILRDAELQGMTQTASGGPLTAQGISEDDRRIEIKEGVFLKNDESTEALIFTIQSASYGQFPERFVLEREDQRLRFYQPQTIGEFTGDMHQVVYPESANFDALASEQQAKKLLQSLQTLTITA